MHPELCKNCEHTFQGNFCSNCGQKTNTVRLNWYFVVDELKYTFLHINKGLLYSCKQLLIRPGDTVREFLEGKRVKHYKPILLIVVLTGVSGLLMHFLPMEELLNESVKLSNDSNIERSKFVKSMTKFMDWFTKNYAFFELGMVPVFSLCSWLAFKKYGYNYIENIIINCFASAQRLLAGILFFPLEYLTLHTSFFSTVASLSTIVGYGMTGWLYFQLYKKLEAGSVVLRMLLFGLFSVILISLIGIIVVLGIVLLLKAGYIDKSILPI